MTGWIPERVSLSSKGDDQRFDKDKEFKRILDRFHRGHCLVTIATGDISEAEADRAGLVPTHAYAMLDIREVKVICVQGWERLCKCACVCQCACLLVCMHALQLTNFYTPPHDSGGVL